MSQLNKAQAAVVSGLVDIIEANEDIHDQPISSIFSAQDAPSNAITGNYYNGSNLITLAIAAWAKGYTSSRWGTYKQWESEGKKLVDAKGHGVRVVYYGRAEKIDSNGNEKLVPFFRYAVVFNESLTEGYGASNTAEKPPVDFDKNLVRSFVGSLDVDIRHAFGNKAFYYPKGDFINMPPLEHFRSTEGYHSQEGNYYATLFHELTHLTGHKTRLNRIVSTDFNSDEYRYEELIAELGASFLCAHFKFEGVRNDGHAIYLGCFLRYLKREPSLLFDVAKDSKLAVDFLFKMSGESMGEGAALTA